MPDRSFVIAGAGAIGCFVGGALLAAGKEVAFLGREKAGVEIDANGLRVQPLGKAEHGPFDGLEWVTDAQNLAPVTHWLVSCKSMDTSRMAETIALRLRPGDHVVSLQNGLDNVAMLRDALPEGVVVHPAMVSFNVIETAPGRFAQATEGAIYLNDDPALTTLAEALRHAGIAVEMRSDMADVQFSKLLMNLNNALNALSGLPLAQQLRNRAWRRVLAACMAEGLTVAKASDRTVVSLGKVPLNLAPHILRLPDFLYTRIAASMLKVDPAARSSMADDLARGRPPEVDHLNGKIVDLAKSVGLSAPVNQAVTKAVKQRFGGDDTAGRDPAALL